MINNIDKIADAEAEILKVLWANGAPMTSRQIRDALSDESDWQRTTVQTLIKRLVDKKVLLLEEKGDKGVYYYSPYITQNEFASSRTVEFLKKVFSGNAKTLVSTMLNNNILSDDDMNDLKRYWQERKGHK